MLTEVLIAKYSAMSDEELLESNTTEAAQFLLDRQDAAAAMNSHGDELAQKGVSWWLDREAHGMTLAHFLKRQVVSTTEAPAPAPQALTIAEIRASLTPEEIAMAEARAAAAVAKVKRESIQAGWKAAAERVAAEQTGKTAAPSSWASTIAKFTSQQNHFRRNQ